MLSQRPNLSFGTDVFLNLLIVTETSCSRSQPRRFSTFFDWAEASVFPVDIFSCTQKERPEYDWGSWQKKPDLSSLQGVQSYLRGLSALQQRGQRVRLRAVRLYAGHPHHRPRVLLHCTLADRFDVNQEGAILPSRYACSIKTRLSVSQLLNIITMWGWLVRVSDLKEE